MDPAHLLTLGFLVALGACVLLQWWLLRRQQRHVAAHRDRVPGFFADRIPLEDHQKAADYTLAKIRIGRWDILLDAIVLLGWTLGGGLSWLFQWWQPWDLAPTVTGVLFILSVFLINGLIALPFSAWQTFGVEARFGFNRTTVGRFIGDHLLQTLLAIALGGPLLWVLLWLMAYAGTLWWLWAWAVWMGFSLFISWAYPVVIAPLFNKFTPLADKTLRARIQRLLERNGFRSKGVFVMDGSRRSGHGNAYFTGLGRNKRIVFYDTLLEGLTPEEVEAVLAHELGHYKRHHVHKLLGVTALLSLLGLALLGWLAQQPWFYFGLGVSEMNNAAALVLFIMVTPVFTRFFEPVMTWMSRRHEFEADDFAASQVNAESLIHALVKLYKDNASTLTPDPVYADFYYSHPPAAVRIAHLSAKMKA